MLTMNTEISLNTTRDRLWEALTTPSEIEKYFVGTKVSVDWVVGQKITWTGEWEGKEYKEWANIIEFSPKEKIVFDYFSPAAGLPESAENYNRVTQEITGVDGDLKLTIKQEGIKDEETSKHMEDNWNRILRVIKSMVES